MPNLRKILEHLAETEPQSTWTDGKMEMYPGQSIAYWNHLLDREAYYDGKVIELIGKITDRPFFSGVLMTRRQGSRVAPYLVDPVEREDRSKPAA